jgi:hypothetical protein
MVILISVVLSAARKHSEFWITPGKFRSSGAGELRRNDGRAGSFRSCDENVRLTHSACRLWTVIAGDRDARNHFKDVAYPAPRGDRAEAEGLVDRAQERAPVALPAALAQPPRSLREKNTHHPKPAGRSGLCNPLLSIPVHLE